MDDKYTLGNLLIEKKLTLATAESLTGGMCGEYITSFSGASKYYKGGIITYSNVIKEKLGVSEKTISEFGAVSSNTAIEMAYKAKEFFSSDIGISFTGNAGPEAMENKPVGLVYIGIAYKNDVFVYSNIFSGDRKAIREKSVAFAIHTLEDLLN